MAVTPMQQRFDTSAEWTTVNPVLRAGEIGHEINTGKSKIGDGTTSWTSLSYWSPAGDSAITLAATATVYVTGTGSDTNDGLTWGTAFATVQHAINSLPVTGGMQLGIVEVGAGTFTSASTITVADTQVVWLRGRGQGQNYDNQSNVTNPAYLTQLHYTGSSDAAQVNGPVSFGPSGSSMVPYNVIISDMAITGTSSARYGISVTNTERFQMHRVSLDTFGTAGYHVINTYWFELDWVTITNCGKTAATTPTAGVYIDVPDGEHAVNLGIFKNCIFNENVGYNVYNTGGIVMNFLNTDFSHAVASQVSNSGSGIYCGVGSGPISFYGCWFESNQNYGSDVGAGGGPFLYTGCYFTGGHYSPYAVNTGLTQYFAGCSFSNHTSGFSIDNRNGNCLNWAACNTSDTSFIRGVDGGNYPNQDIPAAMSLAFGTTYSSYVGSYGARSVSGSITIHTNLGNSLELFLTGNVTASAFDNNTAGQTLTVSWVQPASGGPYTYVWPSNCVFAGQTAPVASTAANAQDSVTFYCDGTNWRETSRSPGNNVETSKIIEGTLVVDSGTFSAVPFLSSEDGTQTSHGALMHVLGANDTEGGHYILWFDETGPYYLGLAMAVGVGRTYNGHPINVLGGFWNGLAVQGVSHGTGTPIFGALTSNQSGTTGALVVWDDNNVKTLHNILDDGSGNLTVAGDATVDGGITVGTYLSLGGGAQIGGGLNVVNVTGAGEFIVYGPGDANQYSNFIMADNNGFSGHQWTFSHRVSSHQLWIYNYNGSTYTNVIQLDEAGDVTLPVGKLIAGPQQQPVLTCVATTGINGFTLQNGTPSIMSWTAPNDGQLHRFQVFGQLNATGAVGGQINVSFTSPDGSIQNRDLLDSFSTGWYDLYTHGVWLCSPGSTVTVSQHSAVTSGTAKLYAELWAS